MSEIRLVPLDVEGCADGLLALRDGGHLTDLAWYDARLDSRRYSVLVSRDNIGGEEPDWRWHVSVAGQSDVPKWRDLVALTHKLRPGVVFVVGVPPRSWWINVHPHTLHLYETCDANLEAQWRAERSAMVPS